MSAGARAVVLVSVLLGGAALAAVLFVVAYLATDSNALLGRDARRLFRTARVRARGRIASSRPPDRGRRRADPAARTRARDRGGGGRDLRRRATSATTAPAARGRRSRRDGTRGGARDPARIPRIGRRRSARRVAMAAGTASGRQRGPCAAGGGHRARRIPDGVPGGSRSSGAGIADRGRAHPTRRAPPAGEPTRLGAGRDPRVLEDLHARGVCDRALPLSVVRADIGAPRPRVSVPLLHVRRRAGREAHLRPGRALAAAATARDRRRTAPSSPLARSRGTSDPPGGECASDGLPASGRGARTGRLAPRARDRALRLSRPLDVPVRRDRPLLLRRPRRDGRVPLLLVRSEPRDDDVPRCLRAARGHADVGRVPLDRRHVARDPRGAARPPDASLGGARVHRGDRPASHARVLHRRVPQAARSQLVHRPHDADARSARGLHRLHAARRPALRHGHGDRLLRGAVDPMGRRAPRALALGRRLPRLRRDRGEAVHRTRPAAARASSPC